MATEKGCSVMVSSGMFTEPRNVYGVKASTFDDDSGCEPLDNSTGWIHLEGKKAPVRVGSWGGSDVWKLDDESPDMPRCNACGSPLYYGAAGWECGPCFLAKLPKRAS
jgi:hypothetical protein